MTLEQGFWGSSQLTEAGMLGAWTGLVSPRGPEP